MYILKIGRAFPDEATGMIGVFEFEQAKALMNNGNEVVYAFCDTRSIKRLRKYSKVSTEYNGVNVYGYHMPIGGLPQRLFSRIKKKYYKKMLREVIKNHGIPDVVHVHFPLLTLTEEIWYLLKEFNCPIVVTEHWSKVQIKDLEKLRVDLLNLIVNESDEFICVGDLLKKSIIEITNTDREIKVIPNMVSPIFNFSEKSNEDVGTYTFIAIGRLVELKRFDIVIKAFTEAFPYNKNIELIIVGGGPQQGKLKRLISDLGMTDRVFMKGFLPREETANLLKQSDAFVSASVLETFGVPFIEALYCGKPVIGVEGSSIDQYINKSNGILFEKDNLNKLVRSLKQNYKNKQVYDSKQIQKQAIEVFSENAVTNKLLSTYKKL